MSEITKACPNKRGIQMFMQPTNKLSIANAQSPAVQKMEMRQLLQGHHELSVLDNTPKATYLFCKFCAQIAQATDWEEVLAAEEVQEASDA